MEDREIVDLLFVRSERGLDELERKYGRRLHALAMNILADRRDAEECLNDVRLAVWNAIPPERPRTADALAQPGDAQHGAEPPARQPRAKALRRLRRGARRACGEPRRARLGLRRAGGEGARGAD